MMSSETAVAPLPDDGEIDPELKVFKTILRSYRFVADHWRELSRLGSRYFLASIAFFAISVVLDAVLLRKTGGLGFTYAVIPLAGYFAIGFAVRCHRYYHDLEEEQDSPEVAEEVRHATFAYGILMLKCAVVLLAPLVLVAFIAGIFELPQAGLLLLAAPVILLMFYFAGRLSILFPIAAFSGKTPPLDFRFISKGYGWKLALLLAFAPWPASLALKAIEWLAKGQSLFVQVPLFSAGALVSFINIAVVTTALSMAYFNCRAGNEEALEDMYNEEEARAE